MSSKGFWEKLQKPFFVLAPMADVTDAAFRRIIAKYGKPDVMWTEFVSVEGLCSPGREVLLRDFMFTDAERPIVAQIFGSTPDKFFKVAGMIHDLGFDGIDINMGCPDRNVEKQGGGASMMKNPSLAQEVIAATIEGGKGLPVSVKTRVGYNKVELDTWLPKLLEMKLAAITIHARTRKEMSLVPANWEHVKRAVEMAQGTGTLIIGNGDVSDLDDARKKVEETGCHGVMLGRGVFSNPFVFDEKKDWQKISVEERLDVLLEHTRLFEKFWGNPRPVLRSDKVRATKGLNITKNGLLVKNRGNRRFGVMKKFFKIYISGFDGAVEMRRELMEAGNAEETEEIVRKISNF
jgi:nifR3 family TIM-barrel protein